MSHEYHGISNHWQFNCLLNNLFRLTTIKEYISAAYYWPFVREIHWWLVDSPHIGPLMHIVFPGHDIMVEYATQAGDLAFISTGIILYMCSANERWCCNVTTSLIGLVHAQNDPCVQSMIEESLCSRNQFLCLATTPMQYSLKSMTFVNHCGWKQSTMYRSWKTYMNGLTHLLIVLHICVSKSCHHWFRWWLVAYSAPSHYVNQCWVIVNWILGNKLQWNFNQNIKLFIHENATENIVCKMAAILVGGRWANARPWHLHCEMEIQQFCTESLISYLLTHKLLEICGYWCPGA